jgi:hypothetical protein
MNYKIPEVVEQRRRIRYPDYIPGMLFNYQGFKKEVEKKLEETRQIAREKAKELNYFGRYEEFYDDTMTREWKPEGWYSPKTWEEAMIPFDFVVRIYKNIENLAVPQKVGVKEFTQEEIDEYLP